MLRTSAMLYKPEAEGQYFNDWGMFVKKLKTIDFDALDKENFEELLEELEEKAISIRYTSEMFVALQELINSLYVFVLMEQDKNVVLDIKIQEKLRICEEIIAKIDAQMHDDECEILPMVLEERLCQLEGVPEEIAINVQQLEGCMGLIKESFGRELDDNGLVPVFENMEKAQTLLSDSLFVEFKEEALEEVTEQMAEQETEKLVDEFAQLFQGKSIKVVRAVIASTIARMPVFFANTEEVAEYIQLSLEQCKDHAEKQASYEILIKMMEEEN